ncbi:precorrin-2 dehydrogenase/sirohydrochlorin ferrochelatase family protein [Ferrimonas aestuarii]|uniref:precorrin-2 dehydrogenase n=1 Tax=Ferrimonas aestuarii TaxID=2569539 RepID=A0A4U1BPU1_9GAMM|nr:bifunctional precorrin-2 dehydrogenase/sirohydrochlorin ferrochelatase [Ferrimonas aestuarii]TKB56599.1 bifunctional precorrin-2 dehydrogenase/sirohydrochlorin ferrochelatase [Ferrimonas aestuarii]
MRYFPLFFDTQNQSLLIVGGGEVAARKLTLWRRTQMDIVLVAPFLCQSLQLAQQRGDFHWFNGEFTDELVAGKAGVIAATNNEALNVHISHLAKAEGAWVNVVDNPEACTVITPAIVDRSPMVVAIGSEGGAPVLVKELRKRIETWLPNRLGKLAQFMAERRYRVPLSERKAVWERFLNSNGLTLEPASEQRFEAALAADSSTLKALFLSAETDSQMLPIAAVNEMQEAESVIHSRALPKAIDELCRRDAERHQLDLHQALAQPGWPKVVVVSADELPHWREQFQLQGVTTAVARCGSLETV